VRALALVAFALLAGCNSKTGADGYAFERSDFERSDVLVHVVQYATRPAFDQAALDHGIADPGKLAAFGTVRTAEPECTIHVLAIPQHYQPEYLGHELTHCLYGQFHGGAG
jgi:hypothetical protein